MVPFSAVVLQLPCGDVKNEYATPSNDPDDAPQSLESALRFKIDASKPETEPSMVLQSPLCHQNECIAK